MNKKGSLQAFIIPHYSNEGEGLFVAEAIEALFSPTDDDWSAIIVVIRRQRQNKDYNSNIQTIILLPNVFAAASGIVT